MDAWARLSILVVASALGAYGGIRAHDRALREDGAALAPPVEPPVEAPATMVGEAILVSPDATWHEARAAVGGIVLLTPETFGGLLSGIARAPALSPVIDGASPAYGVADGNGGWVVAAHVVSPQTARSTLEGDPTALGLPVVGHAGAIDVMQAPGASVGLAGAFVLVASDRAALETLGPYAYRTLPPRKLPESPLVARLSHPALAGPIHDLLAQRWARVERFLLEKDDEQRADHGGREPDLADPRVVVAELDTIEKRYADRITAMESATVTFDVDDDALHARLTFAAPHHGELADWVESLEGGSTAPLAASSQATLATVFWRSDTHNRESAAKEASDVVTRALGDRLPATDEAKLGEILARLGRARAGWALGSVTGGPETGALLRFAASDPAALESSLASLVDLAREPAWAKWENAALGITKIERSGSQATFTRASGTLHASWVQRGGEVDVGMGVDAAAVLASAAGQSTLASDPKVSSWLRSLRSNVVWALVTRPLLLAASPRSDALLVGLLHGHGTLSLDARVPGIVARQLIASAGGF